MASLKSVEHFCTLCQEEDLSKIATTWCLDCEDFFCEQCHRHHAKFKLLKQHKTITTQDYDKLPDSVLGIRNICHNHEEKLEFFCPLHGKPCCVKCMKEHRECENVGPLREVLENVKASPALSHLERDLEVSKENYDKIKKQIADEMNKQHQAGEKFLQDILKLRRDINDHLDKIEKNLKDEIAFKQTKIEADLKALFGKIETKLSRIVTMQDELLHLKELASDLQTFLGIKKIEKQLMDDTKYIHTLIEDESLHKRQMKLQLLPLDTFIKSVTTFGTISIENVPSNLKLDIGRADHAQRLVPVKPDIQKISLTKTITMQLPMKGYGINVTGCTILPNNKFVFVDQNNNRLVLFDKNGTFEKEIVFYTCHTFSYLADVCYIDDNRLIVCDYFRKQLVLVDMSEDKILKQSPVSYDCYGIDYQEGCLYVHTTKNVILVLDKDFNTLSKVSVDTGGNIGCLSVFKDKLYCTDNHLNTVFCFQKTGQILWKHEHDSIKKPHGIAVDHNGLIYVASSGKSSVVAIWPDTRETKVVLSGADGLKETLAIHIDREKSRLLACSYDGEGYVFSLD